MLFEQGGTVRGLNIFIVNDTLYQVNVNLSVSYTDDPGQAVSQDGWNLVGNPYYCPVDWQSASWTKTNMSDEIHIWDPQISNYISFVGGVGTNGGTRYIPSGMSFFVKANGAGAPTLTITEDTKVDLGIPFIRNKQAFKLLRIHGSYNGLADEIVIKHDGEKTNKYEDGADAYKVNSFNNEIGYLSTFSEENYELAINSLSLKADSLYLPIRINADSLHFKNTLDIHQKFLLVDSDNEIVAEILGNPVILKFETPLSGMYTLMSEGLYELNAPINIEEIIPQEIKLIQQAGNISISSRYNIQSIEVFDISGKLVSIKQPNTTYFSLSESDLPRLSIIKVKDENDYSLTKKVISIKN